MFSNYVLIDGLSFTCFSRKYLSLPTPTPPKKKILIWAFCAYPVEKLI